MPRRARIAPGELVYHTLNLANGRNELFSKPEDYAAFEESWLQRCTAFQFACSLWRKLNDDRESLLSAWPLDGPENWVDWVNEFKLMPRSKRYGDA
jgi:hypothetical protein